MTRYIDADKLKQHYSWWREEERVVLNHIVDQQPTADVRENVKAEWIFPYGDRKYKRCSFCGKTFYSIPSTSNFCPNCGADMRGDNK